MNFLKSLGNFVFFIFHFLIFRLFIFLAKACHVVTLSRCFGHAWVADLTFYDCSVTLTEHTADEQVLVLLFFM